MKHCMYETESQKVVEPFRVRHEIRLVPEI